jgi:3-deoxy-D-manno-octulosonate 8-phosphate phosphatase (KDO 8-P phosphatase)
MVNLHFSPQMTQIYARHPELDSGFSIFATPKFMESILKKYPAQFQERARKIKALVFDIDGVLTDGGIIHSSKGDESKRFFVRDGQILTPLREHGFIIGAITGRHSDLVHTRMEELKVDFYHQGVKNKYEMLENMLQEYSLEWHEIAYVGDDLIDLACLQECGLGFMPFDAPEYLHEYADIITTAHSGHGVVREVGDYLLAAQGLLEKTILDYCNRR